MENQILNSYIYRIMKIFCLPSDGNSILLKQKVKKNKS